MPSETGKLTIAPQFATTLSPAPQKHGGAKMWGFALLALIVIALVAYAAYSIEWDTKPQGTVTLLVRDHVGSRSVETLSLADGALSTRSDIDPQSITTVSSRTFVLSDNSIITLDPVGIVRMPAGATEPVEILVASPVSPTAKTPLAVWNDGEMVAWVSPVDQSVQVFERSDRGAYIPVHLVTGVNVSSLGFTEDGSMLILADVRVDMSGSSTTEFSALEFVSAPDVRPLASVVGFARIINP